MSRPRHLSYCGYNNPEASGFLKRYARQIGYRYTWNGLKDNVHHTAERHKRADMVAIWNGQQFTTPLVTKLCRLRNIPTFYFEYGMLPQSKTYFVDPSGFCGDSILNGDLKWVTDDDMDRMLMKRKALQAQYPLDNQGFVLATLQLHNDAQILFYSAYNDMHGFVRDVEKRYRKDKIIARPHPKSGDRKPVFDKAETIFEGDFLEWAARSKRVVAVTSTCLYEAAILGVPVTAFGDHPFKTHPKKMHDKVAAGALALCVPRSSSPYEVLDRFGYHAD